MWSIVNLEHDNIQKPDIMAKNKQRLSHVYPGCELSGVFLKMGFPVASHYVQLAWNNVFHIFLKQCTCCNENRKSLWLGRKNQTLSVEHDWDRIL